MAQYLRMRIGETDMMDGRAPLGSRASAWILPLLLGANLLFAGAGDAATLDRLPEGCAFDFPNLVCTYPEPTYEIRLPSLVPTGGEIPVVVIFHDAGGDAADILAEDSMVARFLESGYALIAPDAVPRHNRRLWYHGRRPGPAASPDDLYPLRYADRRFVVERTDGTVSTLRWGRDTGWYFYNIDTIEYLGEDARIGEIDEFDYIGRDEISALREILADAEENYGTAGRPRLIAGVGHGASLVWQIACDAPEMAELLAPVGGAFWHEIPGECRPGAHLIHTHRRSSVFWPLDGAGGGEQRFSRTGISDNIDMLLDTNRCDRLRVTEGSDPRGFGFSTWDECRRGGSVELLLTDDEQAFPDWWAERMLMRLFAPLAARVQEETEALPEASPVFRNPGEEPGEAAQRAPRFKRPGSETRERFKRAR